MTNYNVILKQFLITTVHFSTVTRLQYIFSKTYIIMHVWKSALLCVLYHEVTVTT